MKTYSMMKVSDSMADSVNTLPVMTDEQRRKNLEKAAAARRERKALLDLVREGTVASRRHLPTRNTGAFP